MNILSQYWNMWCINPSDERLRYRRKDIAPAEAFCTEQITQNRGIALEANSFATALQNILLLRFKLSKSASSLHSSELQDHAYAGLCLRCYVSEPILKACQKIDRLFSGNKCFSYQDLLPFVLNDDGKTLIVADSDQVQQISNDTGELKPAMFKAFSIEILKTYQSDRADRMSLDNWAFLRTKQQPDLKRFLAEYGFRPFSDWTLLNRIQVNQLERLSERERAIAEAFHAVYRRDRRTQKQVGRCKDPTPAQLIEMNQILEEKDTAFLTIAELLKVLKRMAEQLRTFDIWQAREPLEIRDIETGDYALRADLPAHTEDKSTIEERDFLGFLQHQTSISLASAIEQAVQAKVEKLRKSKKYSPFANVYAVGLRRYYQEGLSLREIGVQLEMSSWDQTRRILNPGDLLNQVRRLTVQHLSTVLIKTAQEKGLAATPAEPSYLRTLLEQVEAFVDGKFFAEASSEIKAGRNRSLDSDYAKVLIHYLERDR